MQVIQVGCLVGEPSVPPPCWGSSLQLFSWQSQGNPKQMRILHHLVLGFDKMPLTSTHDEDDTSVCNLLEATFPSLQLSTVQLRRSPGHLFHFRSSGNHSQRHLQYAIQAQPKRTGSEAQNGYTWTPEKMLIPFQLSPKALSKPDQGSRGDKGGLGCRWGREWLHWARFKGFPSPNLLTRKHCFQAALCWRLLSLRVQSPKKEGLKKVKHCAEKIFWCFGLRWPPNQELIASSSFNISTQWDKLCKVKKKKKKSINKLKGTQREARC